MLTFEQYRENYLRPSPSDIVGIEKLALELLNNGVGHAQIAAKQIHPQFSHISFTKTYEIVLKAFSAEKEERKRIKNLPKDCSRCKVNKAVKGYRFCQDCIIDVQDDMKRNYLTPKPTNNSSYRSSDSREDTYATKYGY